MYGTDFKKRFPDCKNWGKAWVDSFALGTQYLPQLIESYVGKNTGTNQAAGTKPTSGIYVGAAGLRGKDPYFSGYPSWVRDNDYITYVRNHIYLKKRASDSNPWDYEVTKPVGGRRTIDVVNASSAVPLWEMPYWTASAAPHHLGQDFVFADTHAAFEKRNPKKTDWWSYHSRRGWEDNDYTGAW